MRLIVVHSLGLAILCSVSPLLSAQTGSWSVTVPSPTAASLGKFGDVPVGLYTGVPGISIPLFTAKGKSLQLPIGLAYHGSGVKVDEIGSWVGLGWTLEAGGVITRTVRGLIDESEHGYYNTGHFLYDPANWPIPTDAFLQNISLNSIDGEPDQFFVNVGGTAAQFVMGPTGPTLSTRQVRTTPYQNWIIAPVIDSGMIQRWIVTTEDGTRYTFAARETHTDETSPGPLYGIAYASSWYLTEVRAPGGDAITLQYQFYTASHEGGATGEVRVEGTVGCPSGLTTWDHGVHRGDMEEYDHRHEEKRRWIAGGEYPHCQCDGRHHHAQVQV